MALALDILSRYGVRTFVSLIVILVLVLVRLDVKPDD